MGGSCKAGGKMSVVKELELPYGLFDLSTDRSAAEGLGPVLYHRQNAEGGKFGLPPPKQGSIFESLKAKCEEFGSKPAVGYRKLEATLQEVDEATGKSWEKLQFANDMTYFSYKEYLAKIVSYAEGLREVLKDVVELGGKGLHQDKAVIYAETQVDWMLSCMACIYLGIPVVTVYATLGAEGVTYAINQTEAKLCFCDKKLLPILKQVQSACPSIKHVVVVGNDQDKVDTDALSGVTVSTCEKLQTQGAAVSAPVGPAVGIPDDDPAVIMYTSGTTGAPKGVVLTHSNFKHLAVVVEDVVGTIGIPGEETYLGYLPLAHIFELSIEIGMLMSGNQICYGTPYTLSDSGVKVPTGGRGDLGVARPTIVVFAPLVIDKIYAGLSKKFNKGLLGKIFTGGLASGERRMAQSDSTYATCKIGASSFYNYTLFKLIRSKFGGRLKGVVSGSAPLSPELQSFMQTVIRLADWAEGNYMLKDADDPEIGMPRGEVLVGGPCVSAGYYVSPQNSEYDKEFAAKNESDFFVADGYRWFRTGDVGQIDPKTNCLSIIDRKKDLWKGPNGEYVSLAKVELAVQLSPYLDLCMVYAKTGAEYPILLACPNEAKVRELAVKECGLAADLAWDEVRTNAQVVKKVYADVVEQCKKCKLVAFEYPKKLAMVGVLWTPENDMLTAAQKMKRPVIAAAHKAEIDQLYAA